MSAILLVAHGSADPRAAAMTRSLAGAVGRLAPAADVRVAYLDHAGPRPGAALFDLAARGHRAVTVVPLLLTSAYHGRVDLPAAIAAARDDGLDIDVTLADVLGPDPLLLAGVRRRLHQAVAGGSLPQLPRSCGKTAGFDRNFGEVAATNPGFDGIVLVAAGTRNAAARSTVDDAAADLSAFYRVPARAAFGSASPVTGAVAVEALRAAGCRRVAVASYFLACGTLYDTVTASAIGAGALAPAARPLGDAVELARLVLVRALSRRVPRRTSRASSSCTGGPHSAGAWAEEPVARREMTSPRR